MLDKTNVMMVDLEDWDNLVQETYNKVYSFQQQDGCKGKGIYQFQIPSDSYPYDYENTTVSSRARDEEMGVSFEAWLNRDRAEPVWREEPDKDRTLKICEDGEFGYQLFWERHFYPCVDMIIEDLHKRGLLEEGKYIINIDW